MPAVKFLWGGWNVLPYRGAQTHPASWTGRRITCGSFPARTETEIARLEGLAAAGFSTWKFISFGFNLGPVQTRGFMENHSFCFCCLSLLPLLSSSYAFYFWLYFPSPFQPFLLHYIFLFFSCFLSLAPHFLIFLMSPFSSLHTALLFPLFLIPSFFLSCPFIHLQRRKRTQIAWGEVGVNILAAWATIWPVVPALDDGSWWMWSSRWNDWLVKPKYSKKAFPSATLPTTNPIWPDSGLKQGHTAVTNPLSSHSASSEYGAREPSRCAAPHRMDWRLLML